MTQRPPSSFVPLVQRGPAGAPSSFQPLIQQAPPTSVQVPSQGPTYEQLVNQAERWSVEQRELESRHSQLGTAAMQFGRGALDVLTAPGAGLGLWYETVGSATGWQGLEQFGRGLGESASGEAAMEALAFIAGGGGQEGLEAYRRQQTRLDEQERAWPTLSAVSRVAGAAVPAIAMGAVGGLAGAGGGAGRVIAAEAALGAYEGAGAGAQMAYERAAPLLDVWASMALGSAMGAGAGAAGAGVAMGIQRVKPMQRLARAAFGGEKTTAKEAAGEIAREAAGRQAGMTQAARKKIIGRKGVEAGEADISKMEQHLLDYRIKEGEFAGESILFDPRRWHGQRELDDIPRALEQAEREVGQELGAVRTKIDQEITQRVQRAQTDVAATTTQKPRALDSWADELQGRGVDLDEGVSAEGLGRAAKRTFGDATPSAEKLEQLFSVPGYRTQLQVKPRGDDSVEVWFTLTDEGGKPAGTGMRRFARFGEDDLRAIHDHMYLQDWAQNQGIGAQLMTNARKIYPTMGVSTMRIPRAAEVGKYAWARQGAEVTSKQLKEIQDEFYSFAVTKGQVVEPAQMTLKDIADHPLGKEFLLSDAAPKYDASLPVAPNPQISRLEDVADQAAQAALDEARGMMPSARAIVDDIEQNVLQKMRASDLPDISETAVAQVERSISNIRKVAEEGDGTIGFERLAQFRMEIDKKIWRESPTGGLATPPGPHLDPLKKVRGIIERHITDTAEKTMKQLGMDPSQYRVLHDQYRSMTNFKKMAYAAHSRRKNNAQIGLRDTIVGGATLAGGLASGNPLAVMGAMATTAATKWAREHGQGMVALWAYKASQGLSEDMAGRFARFVPMLTAAKRAAPAVRQGAARQIAPRAATMSREEQREDYQRDYEKIQRMVVHNDPDDIETAVASLEGMPPELSLAVGLAMRRKMEQLWMDLPRPKANIRGVAWESLSSDDVRRGRAMIQATRDPMSVFNDFEAGYLDYDKAQYTWRQNPGLKLTAQAAVMDLLHVQLTDDERKGMPDRALTQLDYFLDFGGSLQQSVSRDFSARIDGLGEIMREAQAREATQLQTPAAEPTMIGRMMRG